MKRMLAFFCLVFLALSACEKTPEAPALIEEPKAQLQQQKPIPEPKPPAWEKQYDLGFRYLSEGRYEEAIIAFTAVIEIDTCPTEAYYGRGQSYYKLIPLVEAGETFELLEGLDEISGSVQYCYEKALQDYEHAIELSPRMVKYYDDVIKIALEYGDLELVLHYCELKFENTDDKGLEDLYQTIQASYALMDHLSEAFQAENDEQIFALMQGEDYQTLLSIQEYLKSPILRTYEGKALGIYRVDSSEYGHCMLYYGDCVDGIRSGSGAWYGYYDGNNYASHGGWREDKPNGYFETKEWNSNLSETVIYRLVSGDVSNGLWNGSVLWAFDDADGYRSWDCTFVNGIGQFEVRKRSDGTTQYIWSEKRSEGRVSTLGPSEGSENDLCGIAGFV